MFEFLRKLLAGSNEGEIKKLMKIVEQINAFEPQTKALTDDQLRARPPSSARSLKMARRWTTCCPRHTPWCAKRRAACWASVTLTFS